MEDAIYSGNPLEMTYCDQFIEFLCISIHFRLSQNTNNRFSYKVIFIIVFHVMMN